MPGKTHKYDVCVTLYNDPLIDARCLNIIGTLLKVGKKIALVAFHSPAASDYFAEKGVDYFPIKLKKNYSRNRKKWKAFNTGAKKTAKINARCYLASDLYSLVHSRRMAFRHRGRLIYDSREIYHDLGPLAGSPLKQKFLSIYEKYLVTGTDHMITSGRQDTAILRRHFRHNVPYTEVLNLPQMRQPVRSSYLRKKFSIPEDSLILIYQGALLKGRGIERMIRAAKDLDNVHICIIGEGPYRKELEKLIAEAENRSRVHMHEAVPYDSLHEITCSADAGVCLFENISLSYYLSLPNKLFEYAMAGLPVIASDLPQMKKVTDEFPFAITVPPHLPETEISAAIAALADPGRREKMKEQAALCARKYNYESQEYEIIRIFA